MGTHGKCRSEVSLYGNKPLAEEANDLAGCSIWAVELLRREILQLKPETKVNAILIDFFLYDLAKEREQEGAEAIPHHRTRSIWY